FGPLSDNVLGQNPFSDDVLAQLDDLDIPSGYFDRVNELLAGLAEILETEEKFADESTETSQTELGNAFNEYDLAGDDEMDWDAAPFSAISAVVEFLGQAIPNGSLEHVLGMSQDELERLVVENSEAITEQVRALLLSKSARTLLGLINAEVENAIWCGLVNKHAELYTKPSSFVDAAAEPFNYKVAV
ncbi:hypothetical protein BVRB_028410, partial [Beta vulgaris subsp. vulgaris]